MHFTLFSKVLENPVCRWSTWDSIRAGEKPDQIYTSHNPRESLVITNLAKKLSRDYDMSKTALVTGASEGIGAEFAKILANLGYDLILVARSEDKLNQLADGLRSEFEVNSAVIVADLSEQVAQDLFKMLKKLEQKVDFLINNAGLLQNGFLLNLV